MTTLEETPPPVPSGDRRAAEPGGETVTTPSPTGRGRRPDGPSPWWLLLPGAFVLGITLFLALRLPVFFGADERAHFRYVVSVLNGELPSLVDEQPFDPRFPVVEESYGDDEPRAVAVANHPPFAYWLSAPLVSAAAGWGSIDWPPVALRIVNAVAMSAGVVFTGLFARQAFPRYRLAALGAAGLAAVTPTLVSVGGYGQNDGVAYAMAAGGLWLAVRLLRHGPSIPRVAAALALGPAALLTRASLAPVGALLAGALALGWYRRWAGRPDRRPGAGWAVAAGARSCAMGGVVALATLFGGGWFLLRNEDEYGSLTGDTLLFDRYERESKGTIWEVLTDSPFPRVMTDRLYGSIHPRLVSPHDSLVVDIGIAVLVVGLVLAIGRRVVARRRAEADAPRPAGVVLDAPAAPGAGRRADGHPWDVGVLGWLLVTAFCASSVIGTASFYAGGGSAHPRYFLTVVPVLSALLAVALCQLPKAHLWLVAAMAGLATVGWSQVLRYPQLIDSPGHRHPFDHEPVSWGPQATALALGVLAGVALLAVLAAEGRRTPARRRGLPAVEAPGVVPPVEPEASVPTPDGEGGGPQDDVAHAPQRRALRRGRRPVPSHPGAGGRPAPPVGPEGSPSAPGRDRPAEPEERAPDRAPAVLTVDAADWSKFANGSD
jgi:hypothetical protein